MFAAIVVVDLQKDFFDKDFQDQERAKRVKQSLVQNINTLLSVAREKKVPIIHVVSSYSPDGSDWTLRMKDRNTPVCITGTEGQHMIDGIDVKLEDRLVTKTRYSAFYKTDLDKILESMKIEALIICGINTHACVKSTVVDAFMRDYRALLPLQCIDSYNIELHEQTIKYLSNRLAKISNLDDIIDGLERRDLSFRFE